MSMKHKAIGILLRLSNRHGTIHSTKARVFGDGKGLSRKLTYNLKTASYDLSLMSLVTHENYLMTCILKVCKTEVPLRHKS